jgi:hypothetical protein
MGLRFKGNRFTLLFFFLFISFLWITSAACRDAGSGENAAKPSTEVYFVDLPSSKGHIITYNRLLNRNCSMFIEDGTSKYKIAMDFEDTIRCAGFQGEPTERGALKIPSSDLELEFRFTPAPEITCIDALGFRTECKPSVSVIAPTGDAPGPPARVQPMSR